MFGPVDKAMADAATLMESLDNLDEFGEATSTGIALPAGVSLANDAIILSNHAIAYLAVLRQALDSSIPIVVNSGTRSEAAQTRIMLGNYLKYGAKGLAVYNSSVSSKLIAAPATFEAWYPIVKSSYETGGLKRLGHTTGMALDIQTKYFTAAQTAALKQAVLSTGGKWLLETSPPHAHITIPLTVENLTGVSGADWATWLALGAAGAIGVWFLVSKLG